MRKTLSLALVTGLVVASGAAANAWPIDPAVSPPPSPILLPLLPAQGVAIQAPASVVLVDLDGRVRSRLPGMMLAGGGPPGSAVLLQSVGAMWLLRPGAGLLRPISDRRAAALNLPDQAHIGRLDLRRPIGGRYEGVLTGHWRYALPSPDGTVFLAQWSGECEVPTAYFARPGTRPVPVVGPPVVESVPESFALGWTGDARAVVLLPEGACGGSMEQPGVYLFDAPNDGSLLHPVGRWRGASMWGRA